MVARAGLSFTPPTVVTVQYITKMTSAPLDATASIAAEINTIAGRMASHLLAVFPAKEIQPLVTAFDMSTISESHSPLYACRVMVD
jgi:hypothetical protein